MKKRTKKEYAVFFIKDTGVPRKFEGNIMVIKAYTKTEGRQFLKSRFPKATIKALAEWGA